LIKAITTAALHNCAVIVLCFPLHKVATQDTYESIRRQSYFSHHFADNNKLQGSLIGTFVDGLNEAGLTRKVKGADWTKDAVIYHSGEHSGQVSILDESTSCCFHPVRSFGSHC
jgi:hypothetical protein